MRHRVSTSTLGRRTKSRQSLIREQVRSLIQHGSLTTTLAKAKVIQRVADKLIARAKDNSVARRRQLHQFFGKRDVVNTLVERVAPAHQDRVSGFTTRITLPPRRGDNTTMVTVKFVNQVAGLGSLKPEAAKQLPQPKKAIKTTQQKTAPKPKSTISTQSKKTLPKPKKASSTTKAKAATTKTKKSTT